MGNGGVAPRIPYLGIRWTRVFTFTPRPLYPRGKSHRYSLYKRLGGLQSRFERGDEEKYSLPGRLARSQVTVLTELLRLVESLF